MPSDESHVKAPSETGSSVTKSRHRQNLSACDPHSASSCPISNANSRFAPAGRRPEQMASELNCKQNIPRAPHFLCAALPWLQTPFCMVQVVLSVVCQNSSRIAQCSCSCRTASAATTMSRTPSAPMSCSVIAHSALPEGRIGRMANTLSSAGYEPNVQLSDQLDLARVCAFVYVCTGNQEKRSAQSHTHATLSRVWLKVTDCVICKPCVSQKIGPYSRNATSSLVVVTCTTSSTRRPTISITSCTASRTSRPSSCIHSIAPATCWTV